MSHSIDPPQPSHVGVARSSDAIPQSPAYQGASLAFSPGLQKPLTTARSVANGALAAAFLAGTGKQLPAKAINEKGQMSNDSRLPSLTEKSPAIRASRKVASTGYIKINSLKQAAHVRGQSPSHITALEAITKSSPTRHDGVVSRQGFGAPANPQHPENDVSFTIWSADETPIPTTNVLVKLFESQIEHESPLSSPWKISPQQSLTSGQSPKHLESSNTATTVSKLSIHSEKLANVQGANVSKGLPVLQPGGSGGRTQGLRLEGSKLKTNSPAPPPPPHRSFSNSFLIREEPNQRSGVTNELYGKDGLDGSSLESSYSSALDKIQSPRFVKSSNSKSNVKAIKASQLLAPAGQSDIAKNPHSSSSGGAKSHGYAVYARADTKPKRDAVLLPHSLTPQLTANSLANAMVASSLASSRAQSPNRPMPPPPRHQSKPYLLFHRSHSQELMGSRTPSPGKAVMRQTMREALKSDDESEQRKKNSYLPKKHPNKHHEGDRKKWRDQISEQERKRYEGVWAANKGLLMPSQDISFAHAVLNLVVRDIWHRSRLPNDVLQDIWDLVDNEAVGRLAKDEFVVGMWLIDQRLKGRKLPVKVSESVWSSARRLSGIKVPKKH